MTGFGSAAGTLGRNEASEGDDMAGHLAKRILRPLLGAAAPLVQPASSLAMWAAAMRNLKRHGFAPKTVFDVGVAAGTPDLYAAFPHARFFLIDPTRQSSPYMAQIARRFDAAVFNLALGEIDGEMEIEARLDDIKGATFFQEIGPLGPTERYVVPVRRFDSIFAEFARPSLCKIDVQGAELLVLRGMGERIHDIDALIVEVSTIATLADGPEAFDIIAFLKQRGFVMFDLLGTSRRPLDQTLAQLDILFVQEGSPFRTDRRWRDAL
jgi:FkbM family methyltransferase